MPKRLIGLLIWPGRILNVHAALLLIGRMSTSATTCVENTVATLPARPATRGICRPEWVLAVYQRRSVRRCAEAAEPKRIIRFPNGFSEGEKIIVALCSRLLTNNKVER
jgi:hypothetical protein